MEEKRGDYPKKPRGLWIQVCFWYLIYYLKVDFFLFSDLLKDIVPCFDGREYKQEANNVGNVIFLIY